MKKVLLLPLVVFSLLVSTVAFSQDKIEKKPDHSEFALEGGIRSQQIFGGYNELTPEFSRGLDIYDGTCHDAGTVYSGVFKYDVHTVTANSDGLLVLTLDATGPVLYCPSDMYVYCYCHPFNPADATINYYAEDDDSGAGLNAAFTPAANIQLQSGESYDIVCTHWCQYSGQGLPQDYTLTIDSDVTIEGPAPVETPLSNWAPGIGIFLILAATLIRIRRFA